MGKRTLIMSYHHKTIFIAAVWALTLHIATAFSDGVGVSPPNLTVNNFQPSPQAKTIFEQAKGMLLQIRTLTLPSMSQASTGSGFVVNKNGLVVSNYHVVSQIVNEPDRYSLEYVTVDGKKGVLEVLAVDAQHDLSVLRIKQGKFSALKLASEANLQRGDHVFSLGKPLDISFAVAEGLYNGVVERDLYKHLLFSGSLNAGMSGGPALDAAGQVIGVNVANYSNGEQVSILIPVHYVQTLLEQTFKIVKRPTASAIRHSVNMQLIAHQQEAINLLTSKPWPSRPEGSYKVPTFPIDVARCWGDRNPARNAIVTGSQSICETNTSLFVNDTLSTGNIRLTHQFIEGSNLNPWRFWIAVSQRFANRIHAIPNDQNKTPPICQQDYVAVANGTQQVVYCLRGYRDFESLYDLNLLVISLDHSQSTRISQIDAEGITQANAKLLTKTLLKGLQ